MSEQNKAIIRRWIEELDKHNFEIMDEVLSPDVIFHFTGTTMGLEGQKQLVLDTYAALPDFHHEIEDLVAEGDRVAARMTDTATHTNEFMGVPPTGRKIAFGAISIFRFVGAKIVEGWEEINMMGVMQQLGAAPSPGAE